MLTFHSQSDCKHRLAGCFPRLPVAVTLHGLNTSAAEFALLLEPRTVAWRKENAAKVTG